MKCLAFFLSALTLSAGCVLEDKPVDPSFDGGVEAGMCVVCPPVTPVCNSDLDCVQCTSDDGDNELQDGYCTAMDLVCKTGAFECVQCNASSDCKVASAPRCNTEQNKCEECQGEADCTEFEGLPICNEGSCVECTPANEEVDCEGNSCDPATLACTDTTLASRETCQTCVSDSDCKEAGNRCVAMTYQGAPFPDVDTGFCLKTFSTGDPCERPYLVPLLGRESLSGGSSANYCGIDEANVTCPAVSALLNNVRCLSGEDSDCPKSGLCRDFVNGLAEDRCTYLCGDADECKKPPVAGSTCGSSGPGSEQYCGG